MVGYIILCINTYETKHNFSKIREFYVDCKTVCQKYPYAYVQHIYVKRKEQLEFHCAMSHFLHVCI